MHSLGTESQKGFVQDILVFPAVLDTSSFPELVLEKKKLA